MSIPTRVLLLALSCLAACSGVQVRVETSATGLEGPRRYAWSPPPAVEAGLGPDFPAGELKHAVDRELAARGFREVSKLDAELHLRVDARVETRAVARHAYNTGFYLADRYEDGVLTLRLTDAGSNSVAWEVRAKQRLRVAAQGYGMSVRKWVETGDTREWRVEAVVAAVFERFPVDR